MKLVGHREKTIDFGYNGTTASLGKYGDVISLSKFHPIQGYCTICPFEQFPGGDDFYNPDIVREYRRKPLEHFATAGSGYGLFVQKNDEMVEYSVTFKDGRFPKIVMSYTDAEVVNDFTVHGDCVVQTLTISAKKDTDAAALDIHVGGKFSLNRASYTQLTEVGPIPIPKCQNEMTVGKNGTVTFINPNLPLKFQIQVWKNGNPMSFVIENQSSSLPIEWRTTERVNVAAGSSTTFTAYYWISDDINSVHHAPTIIHSPMRWIEPNTIRQFIIQRTFEYINGCCSIPLKDSQSICLITDHVALPLGWNRDNYFQVRFLRDLYSKVDSYIIPDQVESFKNRIKQICVGHLKWVYEIAQRPNGFWGRSYIITGTCKDFNTFQLDQQCYPLLELCEYLSLWPEDIDIVQPYGIVVDEILSMLKSFRKNSKYWVFETSETPADDPVDYPYHFSSNVLLWKSLFELSSFKEQLKLLTPVDKWAALVQKDTVDKFTTKNPSTLNAIFSYVCDLQGNHIIYQDANDLILAYAPRYNFIESNDSRWIELMNFGFSSLNIKGYFPGIYGGLGSVHTKNPWPLGDCQELIYSRFRNDTAREKLVWRKLERIMQWDGSFGEAVDGNTGTVTSKHWFSWPGSAISSVILEDM